MVNNKSWCSILVSSLFFLFEFIQINMFNTIDPYLVKDFGLSQVGLGFLSSIYFYSTIIFLLPAGQILDFFPSRKVIQITLILCIIGIIGFSITSNYNVAMLCRFFEGIGSAFCFLGSFRVASTWFSSKKLGFATSLIVTIGMLGGVIAQSPLKAFVSVYGWRVSLLVDAFIGTIILFLIYLFVHEGDRNTRTGLFSMREYFDTLKLVYKNKNIWLCGLYTCFLNLPLALLGAVWGTSFLENFQMVSSKYSSLIVSMIFWGTIVGGVLFGYLADRYSKKLLKVFGAAGACVFSSFLIVAHSDSWVLWLIAFLLLGLFTSAQIIGYPAAAESNSPSFSTMSASAVSFITMSGYIIFQPFFGFLMEKKHYSAFPHLLGSQPIFVDFNYTAALLILPITSFLALLIAATTK